jgi:hypothetical protein
MRRWSGRSLRTCWFVWLVWTGDVAEVEVGFGVSGTGSGDDLPEEGSLRVLERRHWWCFLGPGWMFGIDGLPC